MKNLDWLLNLALDASKNAGKAILDVRSDIKIWEKDDKSLVSTADMISNQILSDALLSADIPICSEEKILSYEQRQKLEYFWLIDPLDGTSGFVKNQDHFCVMISLIQRQRPILSVIYNPCKQEAFYAHKDTKVFKNDNILSVDDEFYLQNKNTALLSVNHLSQKDQEFANKFNLKAKNIGSGLKFCALLEGEAGVYKRFESLNSWDIAAGDFLINQNNGRMSDFNGNLIQYNQENFKCANFLAVSREKFFKEFL